MDFLNKLNVLFNVNIKMLGDQGRDYKGSMGVSWGLHGGSVVVPWGFHGVSAPPLTAIQIHN